ncbi:hydroxyacylglutathione hydrolase [Aliagarivorans marinus]|uniref:hydroxyacylglutathione hydrolase n=1 Tax=Aliagarivorans marinus TaxID=561965 RepID=UPI00040E2EE3|nr:hydroxyacylglutathione hydrolase [Aliagarivorans marinus]
MQILHIPAFSDNYIWLLEAGNGQATVVDPGEAGPVIARLEQLQLELTNILITHHHADHIGGVEALLARYPDAKVYAPANGRYRFEHHGVAQGDRLTLAGLSEPFEVFEVPGHTLDHVAYYTPGHLFIGDTLFSGGCGRLFEGSAKQMLESLNRIASLPEKTLIYPAHEYTQTNLVFALAVESKNPQLLAYQKNVAKLRQQGLPTVPTSLANELAINPFLRSAESSVQQRVAMEAQQPMADPLETFTALRAWKDRF